MANTQYSIVYSIIYSITNISRERRDEKCDAFAEKFRKR